MTTVKVGRGAIADVLVGGRGVRERRRPAAEDLRRAVVARALVTAARNNPKRLPIPLSLDRALTIARVEVSRLQERVEVAKQAKDTEAAVNLGISTKAFAFRVGRS